MNIKEDYWNNFSIDTLQETIFILKKQLEESRDEIQQVRTENQNVKKENEILKEKCDQLERDYNHLDDRYNRLVFYQSNAVMSTSPDNSSDFIKKYHLLRQKKPFGFAPVLSQEPIARTDSMKKI